MDIMNTSNKIDLVMKSYTAYFFMCLYICVWVCVDRESDTVYINIIRRVHSVSVCGRLNAWTTKHIPKLLLNCIHHQPVELV